MRLIQWMKYYQTHHGLVGDTDSGVYDITGTVENVQQFQDLLAEAQEMEEPIDEYVRQRCELEETAQKITQEPLDCPLAAEEVWAAGVTYEISEQAREEESGLPDIYLNAYEADRPELFFKANPRRTVGPDDAVGIREDSDWNVPEPELGIVIHAGEIVGYTIGNDMSSRSIEGQNPLYLPQAKVYERCCSIGPCVVSATSIADPLNLEMDMSIHRSGTTRFSGQTSTSNMVRTCEELVEYLTRHNAIPETAVLLTGTSIVPGDDFSLQPGDRIEITVESIGRLQNTVKTV
jgi:2-dehydro-3-deoxy-D-arabinonate dehydratase